VLFKASWATREAKKRPVTLAIVMCTFKNEDLCLKNVDQILNSGTLEEEDMTLVIVDNGSSLGDRMPESDRIEYIAQSNLGGAGGFTRGMLEVCHGSLKDRGFTHVLLFANHRPEHEIFSESISPPFEARIIPKLSGFKRLFVIVIQTS